MNASSRERKRHGSQAASACSSASPCQCSWTAGSLSAIACVSASGSTSSYAAYSSRHGRRKSGVSDDLDCAMRTPSRVRIRQAWPS
eukprot:5154480-Prymnesium_polylepis.1